MFQGLKTFTVSEAAESLVFQSSDQMFHPGVQGYPQHSGGSGDSNTDRSNTTGRIFIEN